MADTIDFEQAVDQVIVDSKRLHDVVNGTGLDTVITEDGSTIPTVRKALLDNLYFKTPPLPWIAGTQTTVFNQLYAFNSSSGVQWWYAPTASVSNPTVLPSDPSTSTLWRTYNDAAAMDGKYAPINSPIFTGNPQAPTPSADSNSQSVATTAFVAQAILAAITGMAAGNITYANLIVTALATVNNLTVNGTATFKGPVNADDVTGRFQNLVLTKENSQLSFVHTDTDNPTFLKSLVLPYNMQTHTMTTDIIVNGIPSSDNTTMSLTGKGNNVFDYVYIVGNTEKATTEPRLVVGGLAQFENIEITGTVSGLSFSVNGLDISPKSVTTSEGITVGGDLVVNGQATLGSTTISDLQVINSLVVSGTTTLNGDLTGTNGSLTGTLVVSGQTTLEGGFTTGTSAGVVGGNLTVGGEVEATGNVTASADLNVGGNLSVIGDVTLNNGSGTTTVNNLVIQGTVSGLNVDLTGQAISVASLVADTNLSSDTLTVTSSANLRGARITMLTFVSEDVASTTATWAPSGQSNIYNVSVTEDLTIAPWPSLNNPFSAVIYLRQDATGGHVVTLDPSYVVLNSETVNQSAGSVTILQLTYSGVDGDGIDTIIARRP